jgi:hypothetical protein
VCRMKHANALCDELMKDTAFGRRVAVLLYLALIVTVMFGGVLLDQDAAA